MATVDQQGFVGPCTCPKNWVGRHHWSCRRHRPFPAQQQLQNLRDALIDDVLSMTDEEMLAELMEEGIDPKQEEDRMRALAALAALEQANG